MPNCGACGRFGVNCMDTKECQECYFEKNTLGYRHKPNFIPKKEKNVYIGRQDHISSEKMKKLRKELKDIK